jgi:pimeloyl-ACP methyl ester carboxylesterase
MKKLFVRFIALICLCLLASTGSVLSQNQQSKTTSNKDTSTKGLTIEQGTLGSSKIMIAVPEKWNRKVLMLAHGLRMDNSPLTAQFATDDECCKALLKEGWMIASTSYRRNGYLHEEAIEDLDQLRQHIIDTYGTPKYIYLSGSSMGGAIVTKIAETHSDQYSGVLAIGAALGLPNIKYSFNPQMPLLFISNQNELTEPQKYLQNAAQVKSKPVLWQVKRDGHCNLNHKEELSALRALFALSETGQIERNKDATIFITPKSTARYTNYGALANITSVNPVYGNFNTLFTAVDLQKLGIARGQYFFVTFKDKSAKVLYGTTYGDVPRGEWVAFLTATGYLKIARQFENAVAVLGCKEGVSVCIKSIPIVDAGK